MPGRMILCSGCIALIVIAFLFIVRQLWVSQCMRKVPKIINTKEKERHIFFCIRDNHTKKLNEEMKRTTTRRKLNVNESHSIAREAQRCKRASERESILRVVKGS